VPARVYQAGEEIFEGTLYRRIPPGKPDFYSRKKGRATSFNFVVDTGEQYLSTHLSDRITPDEIFAEYPGAGLCEIAVDVVRLAGYRVTYEPDEGPDHAAVWGLVNATDGQRKILSRQLIRSWPPAY
jgi:hypothetical protein